MGPLAALAIFWLAMIAIGFAWYRSNSVSAGRPGLFLILMGTLGDIGCAVWWLYHAG